MSYSVSFAGAADPIYYADDEDDALGLAQQLVADHGRPVLVFNGTDDHPVHHIYPDD